MTKKNDEQEKRQAIEIIESGSEIAGAATGAAIGLLGGPGGVIGGAAAGAAISRVLKKLGSEVSKRLLGPREEKRIGATLAFAAQIIDQNLKAGRTLRNDGFFNDERGERSPADELLEGVLLKARDAYEEKKLRLLGSLYANIAFHPEIRPAQANHLIYLAGQLTYRQLIGLALAHKQSTAGPLFREESFRGDETTIEALGLDGTSLVTELYELYQRGLISDNGGSAWISAADVSPGGMRAQGPGAVLPQLMGLQAIPKEDVQTFSTFFPKNPN